jgi:hypothetical protein
LNQHSGSESCPSAFSGQRVDLLIRIKRCALANRLRFTDKARQELELDDLTVNDIRESLMNAVAIYKTIRSTAPRTRRREYLHIIESPNLSGVAIYTKGKLTTSGEVETYYLLISSKRAL